ncbi:hypothetical protein ACQ4PT_031607 [Festuca glaucescens]
MAADHRLLALQAFDGTKAGVKGLVDAGVTAVPSIFHHHPDHRHHHFTVPVIDLSAVSSRRATLVAQVKAAAETVGVFQVVNHRVPEGAMSAMLAAVQSFNEEPVEAKAPYPWRSQNLKSMLSFQICDVKYIYFILILNIFCKINTNIQRIWQKAVWSIDHSALNVAPPLHRTTLGTVAGA